MKMLSYSSLCCKYIDDLLSTAIINPDKGIEWDLNFIPPVLSQNRISNIIDIIKSNNIDIRYHLPYSYIEIAHKENNICQYSIETIKRYLEFISRLDGTYAVIHIGYAYESDYQIALNSLKDIATYAYNLGIHICIENLVKGLTTEASFLENVFHINNIYLCLDTGHANVVMQSNPNYLMTLKKYIKYCRHAHVYMTEDQDYNHIPFNSLSEIINSPIMKLLSLSECEWYTMELDKLDNQIRQRELFITRWEKGLFRLVKEDKSEDEIGIL